MCVYSSFVVWERLIKDFNCFWDRKVVCNFSCMYEIVAGICKRFIFFLKK